MKILVPEDFSFTQDVYDLSVAFFPKETVSCETVSDTRSGTEIVFELPDGTRSLALPEIDSYPDRLAAKNYVKKETYRMLSRASGRTLPWGTLTGIRPVRLVEMYTKEGMDREGVFRYFREHFFTDERKIRLCQDIYDLETDVLSSFDYEKGYSLYIHIPFCPTRCSFCSFASHPIDRYRGMIGAYLDGLEKELSSIAEMTRGVPLHTVYIGGGTPTALAETEMSRLLDSIGRMFPFDSLREYTVEAGRPDSITREKLKIIRDHGVSRISINPQTMNDRTLERIGRKHTADDIRRAYGEARELGMDHINMDLILGLPGEGPEEVACTLDEIEKLDPDTLTVHSLAIKRAARLGAMRETYLANAGEESAPIMEMAYERARRMKMRPYYLYRQKQMAGNFENVGFAHDGKAGLYNILIMEEKQTILSAGAGAVSKIRTGVGEDYLRLPNPKDAGQYLERLDDLIARRAEVLERIYQS